MCITKKKVIAKILKNEMLVDNVYKLVVKSEELIFDFKPGQFVNLYSKDKSMLLPRPISVCEIDEENKEITLVFMVVGKGTEEFSRLRENDDIYLMAFLGNGFDIDCEGENIIVGGGVGTPPLLELAKRLKGNNKIFLGFRKDVYLIDEFKKYGEVYTATEDGEHGEKGNVIDLMNKYVKKADRIYSCGPKGMLKAVKEYAANNNIDAYLSLEERMGCGFGACVGCAVKIKEDNDKGYKNKKVCVDGPVFKACEVMFDE